MPLFLAPSITRYDLNFNLFGIPIRVHPLFWLLAAIFASANRNFLTLLIWIVVIFLAILTHEMGHALVMRRYGHNPQIVLYIGGGLTLSEPRPWGNTWANVSVRPAQQIFISLAGPGAGFIMAALLVLMVKLTGGMVELTLMYGFLPYPIVWLPFGGTILNTVVMALLWVNIFWGVLNLMPVIPLDGGQVMHMLLLQANPLDGGEKALQVSLVAGIAVAAFGLLVMQSMYLALMFGYLAFQSYQALKR
jgi:stage IV sporulation protein FB